MKLTQRLAERVVATVCVSVAMLFCFNINAQSQAGRAEVKAIRGTVNYSVAGGQPAPLKAGAVLTSGAVIKTGADSSADLFLGKSAGVVRITENTTVSLDKLDMTDTGAETVVEIQLNVPEGTILGNVNKLSPASKYEIKLPNGVAGIRGTIFRASSTAYIVLLKGTMIFVFVPPGGTPTPYTLVAPPAVYFSPVEGVKTAPNELVREVLSQLGKDLLEALPDLPGQTDRTLEFLSPRSQSSK